MKLFHLDVHIGKWRVLVQTRDIAEKAVTGSKIADRVIDWYHIIKKAIRNEHIDDDAVDERTIKNGSVQTRHVADGAITPEKLSNRIVPELIDPLLKPLRKKDADLQNQIDAIQDHGIAVSNEFGNNSHIGISQKALTEAVNAIWKKIESITGESLHGISLTVNPTYFIDEEGGVLHISANSMGMSSIFEKLSFCWNYEQEPFLSYEDIAGIDDVTVEIPDEKVINNKVIITCKAQILGQPYIEQKTVTRYSSFFLGSGATYEDLMINGSFNPVYSKPIARHMRAAYDVQVAEGDHIIIVMGESLRPGFIRADINGIEIPFSERTVTVNDTVYAVLTSVDTYSEGTINVDING